ncbi:MAG: UDP-2,3-diacylglucosamine diphosphatase [Bacteriovoracaceae bacterium]
MKIAAISDVHVKSPGDDAQVLLEKFFEHPDVRSAQHVLLLGDIFDLMCGPHEEYLKDFETIFHKIDALVKSGVKVHYFEGNHDVHLEKLFRKFWPKGEVRARQLPEIESWDGKSYYFSHGDEHEPHNDSYQRYKKLILSPPLRFVANHLMPYKILKFTGEKASAMSRKKGSKKFDVEKVRATFRQGVREVTKGEYDFVIGGHSHVQDKFIMEKSIYLNNGYALKTKTFILIDNHQPRFVPLA